MNVCRLLLVAACAALLAGCAPSYVNLTPRTTAKTSSDVYHFEVQWDTSRRGANNPEVQGYVMLDGNLYPMRRTPGTNDRWEADVPVNTSNGIVPYRYKFDYAYPGLTRRVPTSDFSPPYHLNLNSRATAPAPAAK